MLKLCYQNKELEELLFMGVYLILQIKMHLLHTCLLKVQILWICAVF